MTSIVLAVIFGAIAASFSDWLFMGMLFHDRYQSFPEVWRDTGDERRKIIIAQAYSVMTVLGFVLLANYLGPFAMSNALAVAGLIWLIGPLPLLLGNHLFIKLDPRVTASHAAGWLVKLLLTGAITAAVR